MHSGKKLSEHIDEFNKLIRDLANIDVDIDEEDQALMLLTSLPSSYDNFVETLLYGRELLTLEDCSGMNFEGYENGDLLMALSEEMFLKWIMDFGDSYHMMPKMDLLFDFKEFNGGTVLLGDNRACAIRGTGKIRVQMKDGSSFVLENVRNMKENCVYSLDGWAESGEACVGIQEKESLAHVWHKRLGHISKAGLHELERRDSFWAEATVTEAYLINRSPSTALEKKTPMDLWSGHLANYEIIFSCGAYAHVNQGKVKPRVIKCIFMGYADGMKGYKLWRLDNVMPKIIISMDMTFNESLMYKDKGAGAIYSGKEVEFEVELQGSRVELTVDPHTGENLGNEDEEKDKGPQQQNMDNYVLLRDREKRTTTIPARYRDEGNVSLSRLLGSREEDNMTAYAFAITEEEDTHEPITYQEAINSSENNEWKYLYGLKQSLKQRYKWFDVYMISNRFSCICYDSCVYFKEFTLEFDMKEPGPARKILGMEIVRDRGSQTLKVSQSEYMQKNLNNYRVDNGKLVYIPLGAHFRISLKDCLSMKWILKYLKGTADVGLVYGRDQGKHVDVDSFVDADYAKDPDKDMSIIGYMFMVHGYVVSWKTTLQHVVALFTIETEYMALTKVVKKRIWLKGLLIELRINLRSVVVICDNQGSIHLSRNAMFHERTKHINMRYHFIRDIVESREIEVAKMDTKDNAAVAFTKVVLGLKSKYCMGILAVEAN
ncbi:retrovirus-related pol polyprotein from transposon TNT 1-94 [Tanacetum coccineum]